MALGWKVLIPFALTWVAVVAVTREMPAWVTTVAGFGLVFAALLAARFGAVIRRPADRSVWATTYVNPMATGFPVPPLPGKRTPDPLFIIRREDIDA